MIHIATRFDAEMTRVESYIDLVIATFTLSRTTLSRFRSKHPISLLALDVHSKARAIALGDSLAFEGSYLVACAAFEQAVRDMIDETATQASNKKIKFSDLPREMQENHLDGCIDILSSRNQDKFKHLSSAWIVESMGSCHAPTLGITPYKLVLEAFSSHRYNFRPKVLKEQLKRLEVKDLWKKLGNDPVLQSLFPGASAHDAQLFSCARLEGIMSKRNWIIHRGVSYVPPTDSEVKEATLFLRKLIYALANCVTAFVAGL